MFETVTVFSPPTTVSTEIDGEDVEEVVLDVEESVEDDSEELVVVELSVVELEVVEVVDVLVSDVEDEVDVVELCEVVEVVEGVEEVLLVLLLVLLGVLDVLEEEAFIVPLACPNWMYPNRPWNMFPHLSVGYPAQASSHDPTLVVSDGAMFEHQHFCP